MDRAGNRRTRRTFLTFSLLASLLVHTSIAVAICFSIVIRPPSIRLAGAEGGNTSKILIASSEAKPSIGDRPLDLPSENAIEPASPAVHVLRDDELNVDAFPTTPPIVESAIDQYAAIGVPTPSVSLPIRPKNIGTPGGTIAPKGLSQNKPPRYPSEARRNNWEGTAVVRLHLSATGHVEHLNLETTSGHVILDDAATEAVKDWIFSPSTINGHPIACDILLPIRFKLRR